MGVDLYSQEHGSGRQQWQGQQSVVESKCGQTQLWASGVYPRNPRNWEYGVPDSRFQTSKHTMLDLYNQVESSER